jgi:hypothetical protein
MIDMVSAVLGSVSPGPQLFWPVIALHLSTDIQHLSILSLHNFLPCMCPGRIHRERTMRTVQIVLSPRYNQAQWYPMSGEPAHKL